MSLSSSDDLARTRVLFEQWRATRQGRSKIPEELWQAVVALQDRYSASQLCRELHLSAGALRSHLQAAARAKPSSPPVFVPLSSHRSAVSINDAGQILTASGEILNPDGRAHTKRGGR